MSDVAVGQESDSQGASTVEHHQVVVIGAGVSGIYQIKKLIDLGIDAVVVEGEDDLGGTWYRNRYPGCRFDSESYSYGYSWSQEVLDEWHWHELFSAQSENLRYLNFVADKFDLRRHMRFGSRVDKLVWNEEERRWHLTVNGSASLSTRFVITSLGPLSAPTMPSYPGMDEFEGESFHTFFWPKEPLDLSDKRVGIIGTGATGIQIIAELCDKVAELKVFQRRPNWSSPLNNRRLSEEDMAEIRTRYDEIFDNCAATPGGFEHRTRWGFWDHTTEERRAVWDELYEQPGFAIIGANFGEIYMDEDANRELSDYIADRIRGRVDDPDVAEKLIPTDHGFGLQRLPLETRYFEAYNNPNVELVDIKADPIERVTAAGIETTSGSRYDLDVLVYATGFDAITGSYDRLDITGVGGQTLGERWASGPETLNGVLTSGFPNMLMIAGPQSVSGSSNFPRAIETGVDWVTDLLEYVFDAGHSRVEAEPEAESAWGQEVARMYERLLIRNSKGWFTGYNSNVRGHEEGQIRHQAYFGGAPRYTKAMTALAAEGYPGISLD